jgi:acetyl-CoA carboxylase biotin carboxyl carrier protein
VSRTVAALREDGPPPQHITVRSTPGSAPGEAPGTAPGGASDQLSIRATVVGTFYRAPEPGAEPFAREGETVQPGQQVAILEAMKMMLPVEATAAGKITGFLVEDGAPVEFGTPLIALSPASG